MLEIRAALALLLAGAAAGAELTVVHGEGAADSLYAYLPALQRDTAPSPLQVARRSGNSLCGGARPSSPPRQSRQPQLAVCVLIAIAAVRHSTRGLGWGRCGVRERAAAPCRDPHTCDAAGGRYVAMCCRGDQSLHSGVPVLSKAFHQSSGSALTTKLYSG